MSLHVCVELCQNGVGVSEGLYFIMSLFGVVLWVFLFSQEQPEPALIFRGHGTTLLRLARYGQAEETPLLDPPSCGHFRLLGGLHRSSGSTSWTWRTHILFVLWLISIAFWRGHQTVDMKLNLAQRLFNGFHFIRQVGTYFSSSEFHFVWFKKKSNFNWRFVSIMCQCNGSFRLK